MSIRLVPARPATWAHFRVRPRRMGALRAANDNQAAAQASEQATVFNRWLGICRALDRRLAIQSGPANR